MTREEIKANIDLDIYCKTPIELLDALIDNEDFLDMQYPEDGEDPVEIMEYYLVSRYLGDKLASLKEPTMELSTCVLWGRTCMGVAFEDDPTIRKAYLLQFSWKNQS